MNEEAVKALNELKEGLKTEVADEVTKSLETKIADLKEATKSRAIKRLKTNKKPLIMSKQNIKQTFTVSKKT